MTLIVSLRTSDSADGDEETRETDPLIALAGTLDLDVTKIKKTPQECRPSKDTRS